MAQTANFSFFLTMCVLVQIVCKRLFGTLPCAAHSIVYRRRWAFFYREGSKNETATERGSNIMDTFAQIARSGIQGRRELLESPTPAPLPDSTAVLAPCAGQPTPVPEKMRTAAQLQAALEEKRRWAAPFLADHAPALESCREVIDLHSFCWKKAQDDSWTEITLPPYGGPLGAARTIYRTIFTLPAFTGRRVFVVVNGADYKAAIYLNGELAGTHEGFFATFEFDITDQMAKQPRGGVITVSGLTIDEYEFGGGGGFDVDVDDWGPYEDVELEF